MSENKHNDGEAKRKQKAAVAAAVRHQASAPAKPSQAPPKVAKPGARPLSPKLAEAAKMAKPPRSGPAPKSPKLAEAAKMALPPKALPARPRSAVRTGPQVKPSALKLPTTAPQPEKKEGGFFGWLSSGVDKLKQTGSNIVQAARTNVQAAVAVVADPKKRQAFVQNIEHKARTVVDTVTDPKKRQQAIKGLYQKLPGPVKSLVQQGEGVVGQLKSGWDKLKQGSANVVNTAKKNLQSAVAVATDPKKRQEFVKGVQAKAQSILSNVTDPKKRAENLSNLYKKLPGPVKSLVQQGGKVLSQGKDALTRNAQRVQQQLMDGLKVAKKVGGQLFDATKKGLAQTASKINEIKNSPKFKNFVAGLKETGIQVAKFGTTLVVGGLVIAGATALTVATGGLAGPMLVGALFLSGSLGGAAGKVMENALRGNKKGLTDGITAKSMLVDGIMGVVMGPAAKVVGGLAKAVARPVAGLVAKGGAWAAKGIGRTLTRAAVGRLVRGGMPLRAAVASVNASKAALGSAVNAGKTWAGGLARGAANRVGQIGTGIRNRSQQFGNWLGNTKPGKAVDWVAGKLGDGLGELGKGAARRLNQLGRGGASANRWLRSNTPLGPTMRSLHTYGQSLKGTLNGMAGVARGGLQSLNLSIRTGVQASELGLRNVIALRTGRQISRNSADFFSTRILNTASQAAGKFGAYAKGVGNNIHQDVLAHWRSMGGPGSAIRDPERLAAVGQADARMGKLIEQQARGVRRQEVNTLARRLMRDQGLTKQQARTQAGQDIRMTAELRERAAGQLRPKLAQQISEAYRQKVLPKELGYTPNSGLVSRMPGMFGAGVDNMLRDTRKRFGSVAAAYSEGGLAAASGVTLGNVTEEAAKAAMIGSGNKVKTGTKDQHGHQRDANFGEVVQAGVDNMKGNAKGIAFTGLTDLNANLLEIGEKPAALLAPFERSGKGAAGAYGTMQQPYRYTLGDTEEDTPQP